MEFVPREGARRMLDIGPRAVGWDLTSDAWAVRGAAGALVRVRPPAAASPERVERLRGLLVAGGAAAVKILPPAAGPAVAPQEIEASPARGIRETVAACAARSRSKDRARLDAVLDEALSAGGI